MTLRLAPVSFAEAKAYVAEHHRHHKPPTGHKFSVAVADENGIVGIASVGRPVARHYDDGYTLEVNRTCTDGTRNANSMLYGSARRAAEALGYRRLITYTQEGEPGASLLAAGWRKVRDIPARGDWNTATRPRTGGTGGVARVLWEAVGKNFDSLLGNESPERLAA